MSNMEMTTLVIDDTNYKTLLTKKYLTRKSWIKADPREIKSFIPGTVRNVLVKKGDKVKVGDSVLILESMKMQNIIKSSYEGIVKEVHVNMNDKLPKGFLMIEFE